jgi:serine/threonine protein kinase
MQLETSEFERALKAVSEGSQSLDSLLTVLSREDEVDTGERAARLGMVQALRNSGQLSEAASDKVVKTIYRSADPNVSAPQPALSAPASGSHPSNWSTWAENQPAAPQLTPGCVLRDRFVLEEVIGTGGMSVVFRALDRRREEAQDRYPHVAIKVLGDEFKRHPDALRALQRESRKTQRLAHPNIASVYDFDRDGPNVYMVMELLVGEPLDALIRRRGFLGLKKIEALRMLSEMGAALAHAHGFGIVHSDFKPSNAFVTLSGETKVIDFGVSRATKPKSAEGQTVLTMFDAGKLGALTVAYCSPEQMLGDADPDARDDVYALGVVAYEMLSGRHPFGGRSALDAQLKGLSVEPIDGLSDEQNAALQGALEWRREHRTESVVELLEGLGIHPAPRERATGPRPTPHQLPYVPRDGTRLRARAPSAESRHPTPAPPAVSRWRQPVLGAVLLMVVLAAGSYGFQQWQMRANETLEQQRRATEDAERGRQAAEALITQERVARQKADEERLATEAARGQAAARARAKAEKARAAAISSAPAGSVIPTELQRAIAAEEAEQTAGTAVPPVQISKTPVRTATDATAPQESVPTEATADASDKAGKRTLYRWQDESGAVRYGVEVPEQYKDSAIVMLPGE